MGTPSSSVLSPRATYDNSNSIGINSKSRYIWSHQIYHDSHFIIRTAIITLSWNKLLETNTQKMSYRNAQLRRTEPIWSWPWAETCKLVQNLNTMLNRILEFKSSYITLRLGTLTIWMTVTISAIPWKRRQVRNQLMHGNYIGRHGLDTTDSCTHKDVLANPSIGKLAVNSPQNSKHNAKWGYCHCKVWDCSKERHFHKRSRSRCKPSETSH